MEGQSGNKTRIYNPKTLETEYLSVSDKLSTNGGVVNAVKFKRA